MTDVARREARLRPEFAELYPGIIAGRWEAAAVMADRMVAWLLLHRKTVFSATERLLPAQHFEFRGEAPRPASLPEERSRRDDQQ